MIAVHGTPSHGKKQSSFPCKTLCVARGEMNFMIAKGFAPLPIEDDQRIETSPLAKCRRADQHVAAMGPRDIRNRPEPVLNVSARDLVKIDGISRQCAFRKEDSVQPLRAQLWK
jgi:hypothetical protein